MFSKNHLPIIAVLGGTGNEGPGLALRWANQGYQVIIGSRLKEKAQATAATLNEKLGTDSILGLENGAAARKADICVLTVVHTAHKQAIDGLKDDLKGKILVDATARVDFRDPKPPSPPSAARLAQESLGSDVRVVAAFQNVPAAALRKSIDQPLEDDVLICADDPADVEVVSKLVECLGMNAYYAGDLDNAIVVEGLTSILISMNKHYKSRSGSIQISGISKD
ncbi:MAG: NADPH-dependent F420 reductase [Anaerolineales bacterium]